MSLHKSVSAWLFTGLLVLPVLSLAEQIMTVEPVNVGDFAGSIGWVTQPSSGHTKATLIGIHGTPGSWDAWKPLMAEEQIAATFSFHAFDRPGWGTSLSADDRVFPKLADQAAILARAIQSEALQKPVILVAHSWGGPVALKLAIEYPKLVDGMVLIASPADPFVSEPRWYHKVARLKPVQWIIGQDMTRSNAEMLILDKELMILAQQLDSVTQPTAILQGKKDWLVAPENAFYLQRKLTRSAVMLDYDPKGNHFIPFSKPEHVVAAIHWVQNQLEAVSPPPGFQHR